MSAPLDEPCLSSNLYKIVVVGDYGVGKSSLIARFCENHFVEVHAATIGIDYKLRSVVLPGPERCRVKLEIFDTAGLEKFKPIASAYYQNAAGVIIVYDVTNADSFASVERYIRELKYYIPPDAEIEVVGTKSDLVDERVVPFQQAEALSNRFGLSLFEVSAKEGAFVEDAFSEIASRIREKIAVGTFDPDSLGQNHGVVVDATEKPRPGAANWCLFCCFS